MEGQRHLERLVAAYLPDALVSSIGPPGEMAACAGAIAVLDLQVGERAGAHPPPPPHAPACQGALLPGWQELERLNQELPRLRVLDLRCGGALTTATPSLSFTPSPFSRTRGLLPAEPPAGPPFACLRTLVLNESSSSWPQVPRLALCIRT